MQLGLNARKEIESVLKQGMKSQLVSVEQAMFLVQQLA